MRNEVQLITYVDRFGGGGLRDLARLLDGPLAGVFGGVHLLPFFHRIDGADAGFDPIDHTRVDARLGDWADVAALAGRVDVMADVIVNHMSTESPQFLDFSARGAQSDYNGLFLTVDAVFPGGASDDDLRRIYRPRPGLPFTNIKLGDGEQRRLWTTFTPQQIDIDVCHPQGAAYLGRILDVFQQAGIRVIRLDAAGYVIKKPGTSCFMIPETFEFITGFAAQAARRDIEVLVEIHSYYRKQIEIARRVGWVYDFALPPLVLHAFAFGTARVLKEWIRIRPPNSFNVLDTHDGIGVIDVGADPADRQARPGLLPPPEIDRLVEIVHDNSHGTSRKATGVAASNLDLYQVNCTFYDAMARDDRRYLLARALQFFLPGIPQVSSVGLLAGGNDAAMLRRSRVGRDINRHYYRTDEIERELRRPVVRDLVALIRLRNAHPAFQGDFAVVTDAHARDAHLHLRWRNGTEYAELEIDFDTAKFRLEHSSPSGAQRFSFESDTVAGAA